MPAQEKSMTPEDLDRYTANQKIVIGKVQEENKLLRKEIEEVQTKLATASGTIEELRRVHDKLLDRLLADKDYD